MTYTVHQSLDLRGWYVSSVDPKTGGVSHAEFYGGQDQERAAEYAAWKNSQE